ncbi:MAG TPA: hypothetical protein VGC30_01515, partial [Dokdonella sp.]
MLGWFAARARPAWRAPLRAADWDGATLTLAFERAAPAAVALDLDGCFFAEAAPGADDVVRFAFPFAPGGRAAISALPRAARDGAPLADAPLRLAFGRPGCARGRGA